MPEHPLVTLIYAKFGKSFGDLLLVGYGSERAEEEATFEFTELREGVLVRWTVKVTANQLPSGKEPLVLAALFKFLLLRIDLDDSWHVSSNLEFDMNALLEEVGRDGTCMSAEEVDEIINKYFKVTYTTQGSDPNWAKSYSEPRYNGQDHIVVNYTKLTYRDDSDALPRRLVNRVHLCQSLVDGLKRGEIIFSLMNLGYIKHDTV